LTPSSSSAPARQGADPNLPNQDGWLPLDLACDLSKFDKVEVKLQCVPVHAILVGWGAKNSAAFKAQVSTGGDPLWVRWLVSGHSNQLEGLVTQPSAALTLCAVLCCAVFVCPMQNRNAPQLACLGRTDSANSFIQGTKALDSLRADSRPLGRGSAASSRAA
jgi:hypothetical protein